MWAGHVYIATVCASVSVTGEFLPSPYSNNTCDFFSLLRLLLYCIRINTELT